LDNPIRYNDPKGDCPPDTDCGDYWLGFGSALIDNLSLGLINTRDDAAELVDDAASFNLGQDHGDITALVAGTMESSSGAGMVEGAVVVTAGTGGAAAEVAVVPAVIGVGLTVHGGLTAGNGLNNWTNQKGRILESKGQPKKTFKEIQEEVRLEKEQALQRQQQQQRQQQKAQQAKAKSKQTQGSAEHTNNARPSTKGKHEKGQARKQAAQQKSNNPNKKKPQQPGS
jgi:hypothetical protein